MQQRKIFQYLYLGISLCLFIVLWNVLYVHYQYMLDADAVGYLTIAKRWANNDCYRAINGLWSPLNSWLLIPLIKNGYNAFSTALIINAVCGGLVIITTFVLLNKFVVNNFYKISILIALPIVLVYYSYFQVFADLMQLFLILIYLIIITSNHFFGNYCKYFFCGLIIAIAYYAKAYSLPFFILHFTAIHILYWWQTKKIYLKQYLYSIATCIICILPWAMQLKSKYGSFSLMGNAGKLNMSWYLVSHKTFKPEIAFLIPPTYNNSPSFWEDPYLNQSLFHTPFESKKIFFNWLARIAHTCFQAIGCINEMSGFIISVIFLSIYLLIKKNKPNKLDAIILATICVPIGYLTMHIETRYIWLMLFGTILIFGNLINKIESKLWINIASLLFCISIIAYPIFNLEQLKNKGKQNFEIADQLKKLNIENKKITSNSSSAGNMWATAYLSNNNYYTIENYTLTHFQFLEEIKRYQVNYYIEIKNNSLLETNVIDKNFITIFSNNEYAIYKIL